MTAKAICQTCPVITECATWALKTREPYGVWGGLSEDDRSEILGVTNLRYPAPSFRPTQHVGATWLDGNLSTIQERLVFPGKGL